MATPAPEQQLYHFLIHLSANSKPPPKNVHFVATELFLDRVKVELGSYFYHQGFEFVVLCIEGADGSKERVKIENEEQVFGIEVHNPRNSGGFKTFKKIHVLPYKDTFKYNYDHLFHKMICPYFLNGPAKFISKDYEFALNGVRFKVGFRLQLYATFVYSYMPVGCGGWW